MDEYSVILLVLIIFAVSVGCQREPSTRTDLSSGVYNCDGEDTLRVSTDEKARVRVKFNGISLPELERKDTNFGLKYKSELGPVVLWVTKETVQLERFGQIQAYGCQKRSNSSRMSQETGRDRIRNLQSKGKSVLDAWFRSPTGPNGHGYALKYPRTLEIDQNNLNTTRFLYAGPENDPPALTDGFVFHVSLKTVNSDSTVIDYAHNRIAKNKRVGGELLARPDATTVQNKRALKWKQRSAMGQSTINRAVKLGPETLASLSHSAIGADTDTYTKILKRMLKTVRFERRTPSDNKIDLPLAMLTETEDTPDRGCDDVVFVRRTAEKTTAPLDAGLEKLFTIQTESVEGYRNFLSRTVDTLSVSRTFTDDSKVRIYLYGKLSGLRGVCDNPRARIQIEETARRITGAGTVSLFLNGNETDLQPDGRGFKRD